MLACWHPWKEKEGEEESEREAPPEALTTRIVRNISERYLLSSKRNSIVLAIRSPAALARKQVPVQ